MVIPFEPDIAPETYSARKARIKNKSLEKARGLLRSVNDSRLNEQDKKSLLRELASILAPDKSE